MTENKVEMRNGGQQVAEDSALPPRVTTRIRHFTDLIVWQKAYQLALDIFAFTKRWPSEERYALTDQVRRSSRSISTLVNFGAGDGNRTHDIQLGKLSFYH